MRVVLLMAVLATAFVPALQAQPVAQAKALASLGFTYQGQLRNAGAPVNAACDFQVSLWDAADGGTQVGTLQGVPLVPVTEGRFTMTLNEAGQFGAQALNGIERWLQLSLRCGAETAFTTLLPRQPLSPAPYAFALPGVVPGTFDAGPNQGNTAAPFSVAIGRRARATNAGSIVLADGLDANFSSSADNQVAIRALNGVFIAQNAGNGTNVPVGTRHRDNAVVAWGRITASGAVDTGFNVDSATRVATGHYRIVLGSSAQSGFSLVPVVTPELDPTSTQQPPTGAANVRFAAVNLVASGGTFDVYMYNGSSALVDNDFHFLATGR